MRIAIIMTVFNRSAKTVRCLNSVFESLKDIENIQVKIYITNDGSTDNTAAAIKDLPQQQHIQLLQGDGNLFWAGGMINSWKNAVADGGFDGYLWLNDDCEVYPSLWKELIDANEFALKTFGQEGIYVGSTQNKMTGEFTYGGFDYLSKWTLLDTFKHPNGTFQMCQAAHRNITYVSNAVVLKEGIFYEKYIHSGADHDYTYRAYRHGIPLIVLREFVGCCENDHKEEGGEEFFNMTLKERLNFLNSPIGYNLKNTLLFQKRCFPNRYLPVLIGAYFKTLFPRLYFYLYKLARR